MEFDINLILVPVTLVFLVAYLADKFVLKQHKAVVKYRQAIESAEAHLQVAEKEFAEVLARMGHHEPPEKFVVQEHTPQMLVTASISYHDAKHALEQAKERAGGTMPNEMAVVRWAYEYLPILAFLVVVRAFVIEPFNIPSSSMVPTLYTGDFIIVNKSAYGLRLPITHTKILNTGSPKHGDVVVFRYPLDEKRYYIKRVIGVAGDTVAFENGVLFINDKEVATSPTKYSMPQTLNAKLMPQIIDDIKLSDAERADFGKKEESFAYYHQESLGKHEYSVRYLGDLHSSKDGEFLRQNSPSVITSGGTSWKITVPSGHYFVMGDNRDRSEDSRFWGLVAEHHLAGRATHIWMHKEAGLHLPTFSRAGRID